MVIASGGKMMAGMAWRQDIGQLFYKYISVWFE